MKVPANRASCYIMFLHTRGIL